MFANSCGQRYQIKSSLGKLDLFHIYVLLTFTYKITLANIFEIFDNV